MKQYKRIVSALLLLCMSGAFLCSCSEKAPKDSALVYVDESGKEQAYMSKSMYSLWLSFQKSMYSFLAADEASWDEPVSNEENSPTISQFVKKQSTDSAKKLIASAYLFDSNDNLNFSNQDKDKVNEQVNSFASSMGLPTVAAVDEFLSSFGADTETLKEYFTLALKYDKLFEYHFGENGVSVLTEDDKKEYFEKKYVIVDHIYINVGTQTKTDGTSVQLTQQEREKQYQIANEVYNKILAGESFDQLKAKYTNDAYGATMYPQGFFVTRDGSYTTEFEDAAFEMKVGEISRVESTMNGTVIGIHIMKKLPMDKEKYNLYEDILTNINTTLSSENFDNILASHINSVVENTAVTGLFDMKLISALS